MRMLEPIARAAYLWIYAEAHRLGFERALWSDWVARVAAPHREATV